MIKKFNLLFITFFFIGKIKFAPGTVASFITCILFFLLINIFNFSTIFLITLVIFFYSFIAINNSFNEFKADDPQEIVIDEVVGQWATLLVFVPSNAVHYFLGFVLFRIFDIFKPWPINWADKKIKGGLGIMLDDILAAVYAGGALYFIQNWL